MTVDATINSLEYPALAFVRGMVFPARNADEITECTKTALKNGFFSGQLLVDSKGKAVKVKSAKKLHGVGPLWGYDIFLNQRIKVELILEEKSSRVTTDEVKEKVLKALRGRQGWDASADSDDLAASVERASSISEIAKIITEAYYRSYKNK